MEITNYLMQLKVSATQMVFLCNSFENDAFWGETWGEMGVFWGENKGKIDAENFELMFFRVH